MHIVCESQRRCCEFFGALKLLCAIAVLVSLLADPIFGHPESRPYTFIHEEGIDVFEIIDSGRKLSLIHDAVCMGVAYVQARVDRMSERSSPSFHTSLQAHVCDWSRRAVWSKIVRYDRSNPLRERCDDQTCWIGKTRTNKAAQWDDEVIVPRRRRRNISGIRTLQAEKWRT